MPDSCERTGFDRKKMATSKWQMTNRSTDESQSVLLGTSIPLAPLSPRRGKGEERDGQMHNLPSGAIAQFTQQTFGLTYSGFFASLPVERGP